MAHHTANNRFNKLKNRQNMEMVRQHERIHMSQIGEVLSDPDKKINEVARDAGGILAFLLRKLFKFYKLSGADGLWMELTQAYVMDPANGIAQNKKARTSARGNIAKELAADSISWKVFIKGLRFLQLKKVEVIVKASQYSGRTLLITTHDIPLSNQADFDFAALNNDADEEEWDYKTLDARINSLTRELESLKAVQAKQKEK